MGSNRVIKPPGDLFILPFKNERNPAFKSGSTVSPLFSGTWPGSWCQPAQPPPFPSAGLCGATHCPYLRDEKTKGWRGCLALNSWRVAEDSFKVGLKNASPLSVAQALYYSQGVKRTHPRCPKQPAGKQDQ